MNTLVFIIACVLLGIGLTVMRDGDPFRNPPAFVPTRTTVVNTTAELKQEVRACTASGQVAMSNDIGGCLVITCGSEALGIAGFATQQNVAVCEVQAKREVIK